MKLPEIIGTVGGVGYLKPAPGTWGSLAALPLAWLLHVVAGPWLLVFAIVAGFIKGLWATSHLIKGQENHDPAYIVVDEVVGQWIAILPLSIGAAHAGVSILALWPGWIAAFVLFRFFDITKLGPIGWADRRKGPLGVMLDDVIAGVFAAIGVLIFAGIAHGLLGI
ncbi:phosphatidylglycerophosphatase A [Roseovarius sp. LXJ103]|uniref:phosphatidylglycerophosphatase A family protein n=1 Tax=Roseovarius carneus TaxID=2853164 RepID=UPI000D617397|nr:phosphatidylglycerophosphatase A [Roseovarius carneus]MBZ8119398.1 phosphatidylglycerophosphatase A [Roseovarius carneus]PWE34956.1 phosphatidylglycerophosphatase A [Pelagicola sp. LXJ1103]